MDMCYLACAYRTPSGYCGSTGGATTCPHRQKKQTNADRLRSLSDEELAEFIVRCVEADFFRVNVLGTHSNSAEEWLDWLREATDG